jgi:hypothetical protein
MSYVPQKTYDATPAPLHTKHTSHATSLVTIATLSECIYSMLSASGLDVVGFHLIRDDVPQLLCQECALLSAKSKVIADRVFLDMAIMFPSLDVSAKDEEEAIRRPPLWETEAAGGYLRRSAQESASMYWIKSRAGTGHYAVAEGISRHWALPFNLEHSNFHPAIVPTRFRSSVCLCNFILH